MWIVPFGDCKINGAQQSKSFNASIEDGEHGSVGGGGATCPVQFVYYIPYAPLLLLRQQGALERTPTY